MNALPGIVTALLLVAFLGVVAWAYSSRRKHDYEHLSRVPLEDAPPASEKER